MARLTCAASILAMLFAVAGCSNDSTDGNSGKGNVKGGTGGNTSELPGGTAGTAGVGGNAPNAGATSPAASGGTAGTAQVPAGTGGAVEASGGMATTVATVESGGTGGQGPATVGGTASEILVSPIDRLKLSEAAGTATFTVKLSTKPQSDVTVALTSSAAAAAKIDVTELHFTPEDWGLPKTVTVTGIDDSYDDGDSPFVIITAPAVSSDPNYSGLNASNVEGTVVDNDAAGFLIGGGNGLATSENGTPASFTVALTCAPRGPVTLPLSVSDDTEGAIIKASLVFTEANWDIPQTVTVYGLDDQLADGTLPYDVILGAATSTDPAYGGSDPADISLTNVDNDTPGFVISPTSVTTTESGGQAFFSVVLTVAPSRDVTLPLVVGNPNEGKINPTSVTFTPANWNVAQLVTVSGMDDPVVDGPVTYSIVTGSSTSTDTHYAGIDPVDVKVVNSDNDIARVLVTPTSGLQTGENGATATFTVALGAQPTGPVAIALSSSDTSEGTVAPASVVFSPANWKTPQTVTVTGVDDAERDNTVAYSIITSVAEGSDAAYAGLTVPDVTLANLDNDSISPVVLVSPVSGLKTTEAGGTATFTIRLSAAPQASVGLSVTSSDTTEGAVSPSTVIFTTANWSAPQTLTVTGVNDGFDDGDVNYTLVTSPTVSPDADFADLDVPDVAVTNLNDDHAGITVSATGILQTTETGGTAQFTVVLTSQPSASVTVPLSSSDTSEGVPSASAVTFTSANWNVPQTVTLTGVNDVLDDNDVAYSILLGAASSLDPSYSGRDPQDVIAINLDNEPVVPCADPAMIDDMEDGDLTICGNGGRVGTWTANYKSATYPPTVEATPSVRSDSAICMETVASGVTGWGTSLVVTLNGASLANRLPYDISGYRGIRFWARRGPGSSYYPTAVKAQIQQVNTTVTTEAGTCVDSTYNICSGHYGAAFTVSSAWTEHQLPFSSFTQASWATPFVKDLTQVLGLEFLMENYTSIDLQVDDLRFY